MKSKSKPSNRHRHTTNKHRHASKLPARRAPSAAMAREADRHVDKVVARISALLSQVQTAKRRGVEAAIGAGRGLLELRIRFGRGKWEQFVKEHWDIGLSTARLYMRLAKMPEGDTANVSVIPKTIREARKLLAKPKTDPGVVVPAERVNGTRVIEGEVMRQPAVVATLPTSGIPAPQAGGSPDLPESPAVDVDESELAKWRSVHRKLRSQVYELSKQCPEPHLGDFAQTLRALTGEFQQIVCVRTQQLEARAEHDADEHADDGAGVPL